MPLDVYATGKIPDDFNNIQGAIDNSPAGGVIRLHTNSGSTPTGGTAKQFTLGAKQILYVRKSVTLLGVDDDNPNSRAVIQGVERLEWGRATPKDDPINPNQLAYVSAATKNITFKDFTRGMILIVAGAGMNEITDCSFEGCKYGDASIPAGAFPIIVSPKKPSDLTGTLKIKGCFFGAATDPPDQGGGMNNLVHVNDANLDLLEISNNKIEDMYFAGFAVWGIPGHTDITNNTITRKSAFANSNSDGVGISFGVRPPKYGRNWDGSVNIEKNRVTIQSPPVDSRGSYAIAVFRYEEGAGGYQSPDPKWSDRKIIVRDNVVTMEGNDQVAAFACLGACSESEWTGNVVSGCARHGILLSSALPFVEDQQTNVGPANNMFEGNQFAGGTLIDPIDQQENGFGEFTAFRAQVYICPDASQFTLNDNAFGPVSGSNAKVDWPPPLDESCAAGIACFGSHGEISFNDFSTSNIRGWWYAPTTPPSPAGKPSPGPKVGIPVFETHVGCIYLDEQTCANTIKYCRTNFPLGSVLPQEHQVLDVATSKWESGKQSAECKNIITEVERVVPTKGPRPVVGLPTEPHVPEVAPPILKAGGGQRR